VYHTLWQTCAHLPLNKTPALDGGQMTLSLIPDVA
jgi:hypothetical protein